MCRLVPVAALWQLCLASSYQHWMEPSRSYQHLDRLEASLHGAPHGSYAEAVSPLDAGLKMGLWTSSSSDASATISWKLRPNLGLNYIIAWAQNLQFIPSLFAESGRFLVNVHVFLWVDELAWRKTEPTQVPICWHQVPNHFLEGSFNFRNQQFSNFYSLVN